MLGFRYISGSVDLCQLAGADYAVAKLKARSGVAPWLAKAIYTDSHVFVVGKQTTSHVHMPGVELLSIYFTGEWLLKNSSLYIIRRIELGVDASCNK